MKLKRLMSAVIAGSVLAVSGINFSVQTAGFQTNKAEAQTTSCDTTIRSVNFSATVGFSLVNIRSAPSLTASIVRTQAANTPISFDGWGYGDSVNDIWTGNSDARWFKLRGQNLWVASAVINGNPPGNPPLQPTCNNPIPRPGGGQPNFSDTLYRQSNPFWRAGFAPISTNPPNPKLGASKGNCTWYANGRSKQLGRNATRVDRMLGNASQWGSQAIAAGIPTSRTPQVGAIAQWDISSSYPMGHVAVVEQVYSDGTILISESSYSPNIGGPFDYLYNTRRISASIVTRFILP